MSRYFNFSLFTLFALLLLSCGGSGQPRVTTDLEAIGVRGQVESIRVRNQLTKYNKQGYITETHSLGEDASDSSTSIILTKINYDESGRIPIEKVYYKYANKTSEPQIEKVEIPREQHNQQIAAQRGCRYNKDGYITTRSEYVDPEDWEYEYYHDRPRYSIDYTYDKNNVLLSQLVIKYGPKRENGYLNLEEFEKYNYHVIEYEYNPQGDVSKSTTITDKGDTLSRKFTYTYDEFNNWTSLSTNGGNPSQREIIYYER
ncbi:MAG: hypothetical protein SNF69_07470 [Rikenellaceae bacterium]